MRRRANTLLVLTVVWVGVPVAYGSGETEPSAVAPAPSASLVIELTGMTSDEGPVVYAVWSGPEHWLEAGAIREGKVPVENGTGTITLAEMPYGEYAVSVYHDRNGNGRLDTGFFRIPKEPIGTSNDAKIRFGPPRYEDAVFVLDRPETTITIAVHKVF